MGGYMEERAVQKKKKKTAPARSHTDEAVLTKIETYTLQDNVKHRVHSQKEHTHTRLEKVKLL